MRARAERIFYFARQRADIVENDALKLREIAQNVQNSEFSNLENEHFQFGRAPLDGGFDH